MSFTRSIGFTVVIAMLLILGFAVAPGSHAGPFSGLPLNAYETGVLVILLTLVLTIPWYKQERRRILVTSFLLLLIGLKLLASVTLPYGWSVCAEPNVVNNATIDSACPANATIQGAPNATIVPTVHWNNAGLPNPLAQRAFDFYAQPSTATETTTVETKSFTAAGTNDNLTITTTIPSAVLYLNDKTIALQAGGPVKFALTPNQLNRIRIVYFSDPHTSSQLDVALTSAPFYTQPGAGRVQSTLALIYRSIITIDVVMLFLLFSGPLFHTFEKLESQTRRQSRATGKKLRHSAS